MKRIIVMLILSNMIWTITGCGSNNEATFETLAQIEPTITLEQNEEVSETSEEVTDVETLETGIAESTAEGTGGMSDEEIEKSIENINFTFSAHEFKMTEELEEEAMPKLIEAIRYINQEWEQAISGNVTLTKIHFQVGTSDGKAAIHGCTLSYVAADQSEDLNFMIRFGRTSQIVKFWTGYQPDLSHEEDIPIKREITG